MKYKIYFEFFGKRFKTEMQSDDKEAILKYLSTRINIEKIEPLNDTEVFDRLMDIFGFKD
jgi:hypothetical protein